MESKIDNYLILIDTIIKSISQVIPLINDDILCNEKLNKPISDVLSTLSKYSVLFPDIIVPKFKGINIKLELLSTLAKITDSWNNIGDKQKEFIGYWYEFEFWWEEYYEETHNAFHSQNAIFLSTN